MEWHYQPHSFSLKLLLFVHKRINFSFQSDITFREDDVLLKVIWDFATLFITFDPSHLWTLFLILLIIIRPVFHTCAWTQKKPKFFRFGYLVLLIYSSDYNIHGVNSSTAYTDIGQYTCSFIFISGLVITLRWVIPVVFVQYRIIKCVLTLILLMWNIGWAPTNASKWQMEFNSAFKGLISQNTTVLAKWCMKYLQYQLHVSASTLAIVIFVFNLSSNYTICVVYFGGGGTRSRLQKWVA